MKQPLTMRPIFLWDARLPFGDGVQAPLHCAHRVQIQILGDRGPLRVAQVLSAAGGVP